MQQRKNGNWVVRWRQGGKQRSKDFYTRSEAEAFEKKLNAGIEGRFDNTHKPTMKFEDLAWEWIENYCKVQKQPSQVKEDSSRLRLYILPHFGERELCTLTRRCLESFRATLLKRESRRTRRPLSPKSVNHIVELCKKIAKTGVEWGYIPEKANHWAGVRKLKVDKKAITFWMPRERDLFIARCRQKDPHFAKAVSLSVHTGIRLGELSGLKRGDIDYKGELLHVRRSWSHKHQYMREATKNGDHRTIPLNEVAMGALEHFRLMPVGERPFGDTRFKFAAITLRSYAREFGLPELRWHDLRHTFASNLVMAGVDLRTVMHLMGHKSLDMVLKYSHLGPDHDRDSVRRLCSTQTNRLENSMISSSCGARSRT